MPQVKEVLLTDKSLSPLFTKLTTSFLREMGSINLNKEGDYYYYRTSKTLLNSITKNLSLKILT